MPIEIPFLDRLFGSRWRTWAIVTYDLLCVSASWFIGFAVTAGEGTPFSLESPALTLYPVLLLAQAVVFHRFGLYRGIWAFASLPDYARIGKAVGISAVVSIAVVHVFSLPVPKAVFYLYPSNLLLLMAGGRSVYRMLVEARRSGPLTYGKRKVLIVGAGHAGVSLAKDLDRSSLWEVAGFVDDDRTLLGRELFGRRILGVANDIQLHAERTGARHAIIAIPSLSEARRREIFATSVRAGLTVHTTPSLQQLLIDHDEIGHIRPINYDDLLGRDEIRLDLPQIQAMLVSKVVLVTGAGGSIGTELCRQVLRFGVTRLVVIDSSEYAIYALLEKLAQTAHETDVVPVVGDVKDRAVIEQVMLAHRPHLVLHAAAYKHVPLMEGDNAWQAVRNNVLGTWTVAECAQQHGVERFVLVSTDKAVNPSSVMGASKRLAETLCVHLQARETGTRYEIVRFGNVLGSAGSVIPKFQRQIAMGGPVTVTDPEVVRYFMSIPEAAELVLQAAAMGHGGEIFVLAMGEPIRILDLARDLIRLAGRTESEVAIEFTGLRPGEKKFEELLADSETSRATHHPKVRIAKSQPLTPAEISEILAWITEGRYCGPDEVRAQLHRWLPEYRCREDAVI